MPTPAEDTPTARALFSEEEPQTAPETNAALPECFDERVDGFSSQTILWVPEMFRLALTTLTANHLEAMNRGDATAGRLQKAMWRLLVAHIPKRCSTNHELAERFKVWQRGDYGTLLERIESQVQTILPSDGPNVMSRARRARRMSQNGAHRKAVMSLRGEVSHLTVAQELEFAQLLLPGKPEGHRPPACGTETRNLDATGDPTDDPECDDAPEPEAHPAMRGVRFARMTGLGKSGFRLEPLSCMLKCKKRREVRRLDKTISEAEAMAIRNALPRRVVVDHGFSAGIHCQER